MENYHWTAVVTILNQNCHYTCSKVTDVLLAWRRLHYFYITNIFFLTILLFLLNAQKIFFYIRSLKKSWIIHDSCQLSIARRHPDTILMEVLQEAEENRPVLSGKLMWWPIKCFWILTFGNWGSKADLSHKKSHTTHRLLTVRKTW